jgi:uncharacterized protein (TIGR02145 family)
LYNWYAVADTKGLCPSGWHVPSGSENTSLIMFLGGSSVAGGKMKSNGTVYWNIPNMGATNESGFSALPGGYRNIDGSFYYIRNYSFFWSTTEIYNTLAWFMNQSSNGTGVNQLIGGYFNKSVGASVRCLKD